MRFFFVPGDGISFEQELEGIALLVLRRSDDDMNFRIKMIEMLTLWLKFVKIIHTTSAFVENEQI